MAYAFLVSIVMLLLKSYEMALHISILANLGTSILFGTFQGTTFGIIEQVLDNKFFKKHSLGIIILSKALLYFFTTIIILHSFRYFAYNHLIIFLLDGETSPTHERSWEYIFYLILIYNFTVSLIFSFVTQVSKKLGPNMMLPLILGKYRVPREEYRAFLFMDLKSSTTIAETLGHIQYSALIRDCFWDINSVIANYQGDIYQYAGDEVIMTWLVDETKTDFACIDFFFACERQFQKRAIYYQRHYGLHPQFKAGAHVGKVTSVEIGEIKREIAFHGDTLNTAARLQSLCNEYQKIFLISATLANRINNSPYALHSLGKVQLKGKNIPIEMFSVERQNS
jgi:adenylate cyclase